MTDWIVLSHAAQEDGTDELEISVIGYARCRILFAIRGAEKPIEDRTADLVAGMMVSGVLYEGV